MLRSLIVSLAFVTAGVAFAKPPAPPAVGEYQCRISKEYKYRPCQVHLSRGGGLMLTVPDGLLKLKGHIHAIEGGLYFEGNLHGERSFGCQSCAPECSDGTRKCGCTEIPKAAQTACMSQPISAIMKKKGKTWSGKIAQRMYEVIYAELKPGQKPQDRPVVGYTYRIDVHSFDIKK